MLTATSEKLTVGATWPGLDLDKFDFPKVICSRGSLEVRLARSVDDVRRAQELRQKVFFGEQPACSNHSSRAIEEDDFDHLCHHLLLVDTAKPVPGIRGQERPKVVGTYRLLPQDIAEKFDGFYSETEFDLSALRQGEPSNFSFIELGRTSILEDYRSLRTISLLFQGVGRFSAMRGANAYLGCASLFGTDPDALAEELSFLRHHHLAPPAWRVKARSHLYQATDRAPEEQLDRVSIMRRLPPMMKLYVRMGVMVGDGAVIDPVFKTTDVFVVMPMKDIDAAYYDRLNVPHMVE